MQRDFISNRVDIVVQVICYWPSQTYNVYQKQKVAFFLSNATSQATPMEIFFKQDPVETMDSNNISPSVEPITSP